MRRAERVVTDETRIAAVIEDCKVCRIGLADAGGVYIVPMNFGTEEEDGKRIFWFHSAGEGRKYRLLRLAAARGETVGFELDGGYRMIPGEAACSYTAAYRSVIGTGHVHFAADRAEKRYGLALLMRHTAGEGDYSFPDAALDRVTVFAIEASSLSCKENQ